MRTTAIVQQRISLLLVDSLLYTFTLDKVGNRRKGQTVSEVVKPF